MLEKLEVEHKDPDAAQKIENIGKVLMRIAEDYPAGTTLVRLEDKYKVSSMIFLDVLISHPSPTAIQRYGC